MDASHPCSSRRCLATQPILQSPPSSHFAPCRTPSSATQLSACRYHAHGAAGHYPAHIVSRMKSGWCRCRHRAARLPTRSLPSLPEIAALRSKSANFAGASGALAHQARRVHRPHGPAPPSDLANLAPRVGLLAIEPCTSGRTAGGGSTVGPILRPGETWSGRIRFLILNRVGRSIEARGVEPSRILARQLRRLFGAASSSLLSPDRRGHVESFSAGNVHDRTLRKLCRIQHIDSPL